MNLISGVLSRLVGPLALIVTFTFLNDHSYQILVHKELLKPMSLKPFDLSDAMFDLTIYTPIITGLIQCLALCFYNVHNVIEQEQLSHHRRLERSGLGLG